MIPNKLYIPTSTLNFNNIISSESISPAGFYLRRGFGYKRFEKVGPNCLDNRIILYQGFPLFKIDDNELDNYQMVIEIDSRTVNEDVIKEHNSNYFSEETIYLNPFTTRFLFRNNHERKITISKAEPSIETKMVSFYENCFNIFSNHEIIKPFNWEKTDIEDSQNDNSIYISKDRKINKIKGLLYAYLIASNKSISPNIVSLKKLTKSLKNTLSAIVTSPDGRATYSQEEQLKSLYKSINERLQKIFIFPVLKEKSEKYQCDFPNLLIKENLWESWLRQNNFSKYQVAPYNVSSKDKDNALNHYIQNLEYQILNLEYNQKKNRADISSLPVLQNNRVISIPEQKEFLSRLFNKYLEEAYTSDEFIQSRYEFAKAGGLIFKEELQDKWNGSQWQQYINGLLKNLNEYSAFDLKSINNTTIESFAAFCQKGESDIDKLEDYLITNEIGDFRIAYSLWGIIFGFANMPKTLTNDLFLTNDLDYVANIYKYIFKQLHGIVLDGELKNNHIKPPVQEIIETPQPHAIKIGEQASKILSDKRDIKNELKYCKLKPGHLDSISETYEKNQLVINKKFFVAVKKIDGIGVKAIERIKSALNYNDVSSEIITQPESPTLFEKIKPELGKEFYNDPNVWYYLESLLPKNIHKKVKTEIDWIQKVHQENGYEKKSGEKISLPDHSNNSVIKHFENNVKGRINPKLLKKIVSKLNELYI